MALIYGRHCEIFDDVEIGEGTRLGNYVLIRSGTVIGTGCTIGSYVDIEGEVRIGNKVSLQSGCYITRGVIIEDLVFCGPRVVTMNDKRISYRRPSITFERQGAAASARCSHRGRQHPLPRHNHRRERSGWCGLGCDEGR